MRRGRRRRCRSTGATPAAKGLGRGGARFTTSVMLMVRPFAPRMSASPRFTLRISALRNFARLTSLPRALVVAGFVEARPAGPRRNGPGGHFGTVGSVFGRRDAGEVAVFDAVADPSPPHAGRAHLVRARCARSASATPEGAGGPQLGHVGSIGDAFDNAVVESFWARMQILQLL